MGEYLTEAVKKIFLCGPRGPSQNIVTISVYARGIKYAAIGDEAYAAKAARGLWSGQSSGVIGFVCGGPWAASIGGIIGGMTVKEMARSLVNLPKRLNPEVKSHLIQVSIDDNFLGNYHRQPSLSESFDRMSFLIQTVDDKKVLYWYYVGQCYPVLMDFDKPRIAFVAHNAGSLVCVLEFSLNVSGDVEEWNPQKRERWIWKKK